MDANGQMFSLAIVDDEPWALIGLRDIIRWEDYGFQCTATFSCAEEALAGLRLNPVDALITDIRLPEMSGLDLCGEVLNGKIVRSAVVVSAYRDFEYAKRALAEGVTDYLLKPLERTEVIRVAEKMYMRLTALEGENQDELTIWNNCYIVLDPKIEAAKLNPLRRMEFAKHTTAYGLSCKQPLPDEMMVYGMSRRWESFDEAEEMFAEALASQQAEFSYSTNPLVSRLQAHIALHYESRLKNAEIAAKFYISEVYMSEIFKRCTGNTIGNFIIDVRMKQSMRLLRRTNLTVAEIAEKVGYLDASYFGRLFRKRTGISPERFRQSAQN